MRGGGNDDGRENEMKHLRVILCGVFLMLIAPQQATALTTTTDLVTELRTLATEGKRKAFADKLTAAVSKGKIDLLVSIGKLHESLPNSHGLNQPYYTAAADFYRQALALAEKRKEENEWVQRARLYYARLLLSGRGGERNVPKAVALLKQAGDKGDSAAAYAYATILERGYGEIAPDAAGAEAWYRTAIRRGEGRAALALAKLMETGRVKSAGDPKTSVQEMQKLGVSLLKSAAREGGSDVAAVLGRMYEYGEAVAKDRNEALHWYTLGAAAGNVRSMLGISDLLGRDEGAKGAAVKEQATDYTRMAAKTGSIKAALRLGTILLRPDAYFLAPEKEEAERWLRAAASSGDARAIQRLTAYYQATGRMRQMQDLLTAAAEEGHVSAMLALSRLYRDGSDVPPDAAMSDVYLNLAAESRYPEPDQLYTLSQYYQERGKNEVASGFLHRAAETNLPKAQLALAEAYDTGVFGRTDRAEARRWYERAALNGSVRGMLRAGRYYRDGRGLPEDTAKADTYLHMAVKRVGKNDYAEMTEIGLAYLKGWGFAKSDEAAYRWISRGAKGNDPRALLQLSRMVRWGAAKGDGRTPKDSVALLKKAADLGYGNALQELAQLYAAGTLVPVDAAKAFEYFKKAAALGKTESLRQVGLAYIGGYGVERNVEEGIRQLKRAATMNYGPAMLNLALLYRYPPPGMHADNAAGIEWLKQAADSRHADAEYLLGAAYLTGDGVERNGRRGAALIADAAAQGYFPAQRKQRELTGGAPR